MSDLVIAVLNAFAFPLKADRHTSPRSDERRARGWQHPVAASAFSKGKWLGQGSP